jgi:putative ABC transport system permease protein
LVSAVNIKLCHGETFETAGVSMRALAFATACGIGTGVLFGLAPAATLLGSLRAPRTRGITRGRGALSLHTAVVVGQITVTVTLLLAAGLLGRSFVRLMAVDPGFDPEGLVSVAFDVPTL